MHLVAVALAGMEGHLLADGRVFTGAAAVLLVRHGGLELVARALGPRHGQQAGQGQ